MTWAPCPHGVRTRGKKRGSEHAVISKTKNTQTTRSRVVKATHLMKESKLLEDGNCVRRLLLETALLPPPTR